MNTRIQRKLVAAIRKYGPFKINSTYRTADFVPPKGKSKHIQIASE